MFAIWKIAPGLKKSSFEILGIRAREIIKLAHIAPHRMLAIVGAGRALAKRSSQNQFPFADIVTASIADNITSLKIEFGFGWGQITVLHFLTDLGLASKPDIHVVRTIRALALWPAIKPDYPSASDAVAITEIVQALTGRLMGSISPSLLRQMDKTLMEISRKGLV